jgi:hypothetical protein
MRGVIVTLERRMVSVSFPFLKELGSGDGDPVLFHPLVD